VVIAALFLPYLGEKIARAMAWDNTFFGTLFLAASTSLPEVVVSFAAIRTGAFDLLVGGLLGSNLFNILVLAIDDLFYVQGSLYADLDEKHLLSIFMIIVMTAVVGLGLMVKPSRKVWRLGLDTLALLLLYTGLMVSLYLRS
jgi:cation:H+ antiporter